MDKQERVRARQEVADSLRKVASELSKLEDRWMDQDWDADLLTPHEEWPFDISLEDMVATLYAKVDLIEQVNDLLVLEPVTITVPREEYEWLLAELNKPPRELPELKALLEGQKPDDGMRYPRR